MYVAFLLPNFFFKLYNLCNMILFRKRPFLAILMLFCALALNAQNVGINTTSPDNSAALDITATDKGLLVPRMTTTQRTAITTPATGLLVYDTTLGQFYFYSGSVWTAIPLSTSNALNYVGTSYLGKTSGYGSTGTSEGTSSNLYNIGIGANVLNANTTGNNNIALGQNALNANTNVANNIAIGQNALQHSSNYTTYVSYPDIAIGYNTLKSANYASGNIAIGYQSQESTNGGGYDDGAINTSVGTSSLKNNNFGGSNAAFGASSLRNNTDGNSNTAIGADALLNNTTGSHNVAVGVNAGTTNSILNNTVGNTTGNNNTFIGSYAGAGSSNLIYATAIGYGAAVGASNSMVLGGTGAYAVKVGIGTTTPSQTLDVAGTTKTTNFQMTNGANNGYVLQSDASGNATWASLSSASVVAGNGLSYNGATLNSVWTSASGGILYNNTGSRIGLATTSPYCLFANTNTNILGADAQGLNAYSLGWSQAFYNSSTLSGAQGLAVKIAGTSSTNRILDLSTDVQSDYAGTSVMVVQGDGKVGIGTASPNNKLDIQSSNSSVTANVQSSTSGAFVNNVAPSGQEASTNFKTYSSGSPISRWAMGKSTTSESGSNAGSDFFVNRFSDAGSYSGQPLSISRANGTVTVGNDGVSSSENTLKVNGSMAVKVTAITTSSNSTTLNGSHYMVVYSGTTSGNSLTLPTASSYTGRIYMIVNHSSSSITISTYYTANATTSTSIAVGARMQLVSDGSNWHKIN
jgi:hypothetical protein